MQVEVLAATQWRHADTQHQFPPKSLRGLATQGAAKAWEALGAAVPQCVSKTTEATLSEMIAVGAVQIFCGWIGCSHLMPLRRKSRQSYAGMHNFLFFTLWNPDGLSLKASPQGARIRVAHLLTPDGP